MGKGLGLKTKGTHIAFTAGTGCLTFLDLVAAILKFNLGHLNSNLDYFDEKTFKFILYASFPNKEEAIGL
jgi:hypothetical protein